MSRALLAALATGVLGACAHGGQPVPPRAPTTATVLGHYYVDGEGLNVVTTGMTVTQPVTEGLSVELRGLADRIEVNTPEHVHVDEGNPDTGHTHDGDVDAITGASVRVVAGDHLEEWRFEGGAALKLARRVGDAPVTLTVAGRVSNEPDYLAFSGRVSGSVELFERNTALSGFVGFGRDRVSPLEAPPGELALWPATHLRLVAGTALTQLLSPSVMASAGLGASLQSGQLSSPYRRAWVRTTLFPEHLPDTRGRFTGYAGLSWALGQGVAVHARQGLYGDTWGVWALAPEASVAVELGARGLVSVRYRFFRQWPASFYQPRYEELLDVRSSDVRLGALRGHQPGVKLAWTLWGRRGTAEALNVQGGYELSLLRHLQLQGQRETRAHIVSLGVQGGF
ncbi:DUF3570 domain-containing protein [Archangium sp.]|jgi:hypothetical protein|uniref:DUF3570 domain-containing protein n=1 Tax=Archangium sp. TaxID=1872627 RepID=UPI002ED92F75